MLYAADELLEDAKFGGVGFQYLATTMVQPSRRFDEQSRVSSSAIVFARHSKTSVIGSMTILCGRTLGLDTYQTLFGSNDRADLLDDRIEVFTTWGEAGTLWGTRLAYPTNRQYHPRAAAAIARRLRGTIFQGVAITYAGLRPNAMMVMSSFCGRPLACLRTSANNALPSSSALAGPFFTNSSKRSPP